MVLSVSMTCERLMLSISTSLKFLKTPFLYFNPLCISFRLNPSALHFSKTSSYISPNLSLLAFFMFYPFAFSLKAFKAISLSSAKESNGYSPIFI